MRQFVAEQLLAVHGIGLKPAGGKIDVGADREGDGADAFGLGSDMHAHSGKIGAECGFHLAAHRRRH
jgi:hypothetical protein